MIDGIQPWSQEIQIYSTQPKREEVRPGAVISFIPDYPPRDNILHQSLEVGAIHPVQEEESVD